MARFVKMVTLCEARVPCELLAFKVDRGIMGKSLREVVSGFRTLTDLNCFTATGNFPLRVLRGLRGTKSFTWPELGIFPSTCASSPSGYNGLNREPPVRSSCGRASLVCGFLSSRRWHFSTSIHGPNAELVASCAHFGVGGGGSVCPGSAAQAKQASLECPYLPPWKHTVGRDSYSTTCNLPFTSNLETSGLLRSTRNAGKSTTTPLFRLIVGTNNKANAISDLLDQAPFIESSREARQSYPCYNLARIRLRWREVQRPWLNSEIMSKDSPWTIGEDGEKIIMRAKSG
ncbi:hypothetical protein V6N12_074844 [Hibiscus sabdariffa]|uniref:Uncharacterized protein n=1 Tax=Hibiscus sabdariffa TaxID=183260 RepID=A0ABR2D5C0_9ROSI